MAWYNTGTIALTNGSATVTGSGTNFLVGAQIGEALYAPDGKLYEIQTINSATVITLASNYLGSTASGQGYQIIPTQSLVADLASDVTDLISDFADVRDYAGNGKFNDGAVGTPGITFTQDQDNGLYRIGSNNWALAAGGIKQVDLSATDVEINYAGVKKLATTATGISVTGTVTADNAHVPSSGSYEVGGTASGTTAIGSLSNSAGKLALDTDSTRSIHLKTGGNLRQFIDGATGDISFYNDAAAQGLFWDSSASALGLGNTSPIAALDVTGTDAVGTLTGLADTVTRAATIIRGSTHANGYGLYIGYGNSSTDAQYIQSTLKTGSQAYPLLLNPYGGKVGIGTGSPDSPLEIQAATNSSSDTTYLKLYNAGENVGHIDFENGNGSLARITGTKEGTGASANDGILTFSTAFDTTLSERMRINSSGNITTQIGTSMGLGRTDVTSAILSVYRGTSAEYAQEIRSDAVGAKAYIRFSYGGSTKGSIQGNDTSVTYNTSSDYRLKENVVAMSGATERLKQLKPSRFNFIADADTTVDGFLAHEVQDIVPEAITGTKDAMMDEEYEVTPAVLDDDGNVITEAVMGTRSVPDYQGIDQSKLVPLLVATIQELEARIAALES